MGKNCLCESACVVVCITLTGFSAYFRKTACGGEKLLEWKKGDKNDV